MMLHKHMSSGKCKLRQQGDTTTHLSEWPELGTLTTRSADEDMEQQELSCTGGGCKLVQPLWKTVWWFIKKLNILLPYNTSITL